MDTCFLLAYRDLSGRHFGGERDGGKADTKVPSVTVEGDDME